MAAGFHSLGAPPYVDILAIVVCVRDDVGPSI